MLIEKMFNELFNKKTRNKKNIIINGKTLEDFFMDKTLLLLENYKDDEDYINYIYRYSGNIKYMEKNKFNIIDDVKFDILEIRNEEITNESLDNLRMLYINYRPEKKNKKIKKNN